MLNLIFIIRPLKMERFLLYYRNQNLSNYSNSPIIPSTSTILFINLGTFQFSKNLNLFSLISLLTKCTFFLVLTDLSTRFFYIIDFCTTIWANFTFTLQVHNIQKIHLVYLRFFGYNICQLEFKTKLHLFLFYPNPLEK
jgi:hypothetical protein